MIPKAYCLQAGRIGFLAPLALLLGAVAILGPRLGRSSRGRPLRRVDTDGYLLGGLGIAAGLVLAAAWYFLPASYTFSGGIGWDGLRTLGYVLRKNRSRATSSASARLPRRWSAARCWSGSAATILTRTARTATSTGRAHRAAEPGLAGWADVSATILDGTATLAAIKAELKVRVAALAERGIVPGLGTVLVGDDPGSRWYVNAKHKDCGEIGVASIRRDLPAGTTQAEVEAVVDELNADPSCTAFLVQQPTGLDENAILARVDPDKDVDGLHPMNLGWLVLGRPAPLPCTPTGIIELLRRYDVPIAGAHVVVVGRGITVGRPLALMLTRRSENATVTVCHTGTRDLAAHVRTGDIVVAAAGSPGLITADMVKPGAAVLDAGVSRVDGRIAGDVAAEVAEVAGWLSPNPGGVGPMTRAMLLANVVAAAERQC